MIVNLLKITLVVLTTVGLMLALSKYQRAYAPHPEWARKLMHMGSGLIALSMPWLFQEEWPVLVLTMLAVVGMAAVKYVKGLKENLGAVTGSVARETLGEICFPLGAGAVFLLAHGDQLLYTIPILVLTFADASAALIGVFYGVRRYTTSEGDKTLEGSLAFFQTAFLSTLTPLLLFTNVGRAETLLISLLMALLAMLLDAIAWWGLDNFLIPLLSFLMLQVFIKLDVTVLTVQFVITVAMLGFVLFWRRRTTLNDSALLGVVIYGYLCWTLGGWQWVIPPLLLFLSYNLLSPSDVKQGERPYTVQVMLGVGAVGLFWLIMAEISKSFLFYYPYMLSFAAQLAMIGVSRQLRVFRNAPVVTLLARSVLISWLLLFIPFILLQVSERAIWVDGLAGLFSIAIGAVLFAVSQLGEDGYQNEPRRWLLQTLSAGLASLLGIAAIGSGFG
jgi:phytol kinase